MCPSTHSVWAMAPGSWLDKEWVLSGGHHWAAGAALLFLGMGLFSVPCVFPVFDGLSALQENCSASSHFEECVWCVSMHVRLCVHMTVFSRHSEHFTEIMLIINCTHLAGYSP